MCLPDESGIYGFAASALGIPDIGNNPTLTQIYIVLPPKPVMLQDLILRDRRRVRQEIGFCYNGLPIAERLVKRKLAGGAVPVTIGYFYLAMKGTNGQPGEAPA